MSIWLLFTYAIAALAATIALDSQRPPTMLSWIVLAIAAVIFVGGLLLRGIRPPVM